MVLASTKPPPADFQRTVSGSALRTGSVHDLNDTLLNQYFGPPKSVKHIDVYVVYVYEYNLLDRLLPADQLPPQYQYRGGR